MLSHDNAYELRVGIETQRFFSRELCCFMSVMNIQKYCIFKCKDKSVCCNFGNIVMFIILLINTDICFMISEIMTILLILDDLCLWFKHILPIRGINRYFMSDVSIYPLEEDCKIVFVPMV